ncbi:MAG: alpha/beta hydrolase [Flavobacteriaceae bacterium]|nr:alpha/beta hydrolase [Flavobacteriaceae bacterium]
MKKILPKIIGGILNILTPIFPKYTSDFTFNLLSRIKRVPVSEEGQLFFSTGDTTWLQVAGFKTALHRWGTGSKKILFLHGWMSNSQRWRTYIQALDPAEYTCYSLDAPAHGTSDGNYFNLEIYRQAYKASLDITGPIDVLVSHSMGNLTAGYQFLSDRSVGVASYVVMGSPSGIEIVFDYAEETLGLSKRMLKNLKIKTDRVLKVPNRELTMSNFFQHMDKPVFVIHEESDDVTPIAPMKAAVSGCDQIKTLYTSGLDHTLKGPEVLKAVTNFISEQTKDSNYVLERI